MLLALMMLMQTVTDEDVSAPTPRGFVSAYNAEQGGMRIEERVPKGETVDRWTRMITVQRMRGGAQVGGPALLAKLSSLFSQSCLGSIASPVATAGDSASIRIDCPLNQETGKPETMFARAFTGMSDLLLVQYAFRSVPTPAQANEAQSYLATVVRCGGTAPACVVP
jgi:hypothetical protein